MTVPSGKGRHRRGAAVRDVRLRDRSAFRDAGARDVHDGVQEVRRDTEQHRRRNHRTEQILIHFAQYQLSEVANHGEREV
jgi:hypothetical protein